MTRTHLAPRAAEPLRPAPRRPDPAPRRPGARRLVPLGLIAAGAATGWWLFGDSLTFQALAENRALLIELRDRSWMVAALVFVAVYVGIVAFSLPGAAVASLTGGFLFGLGWGTFLNVTAATIGATLIFLAARWGLGEYLSRRLETSDSTARLMKGLHENELSFLFVMRLIPAVPFFAANLVPALVGVRTGRFVFTTFFGIIPGAIVYTWLGVGLGEVLARGETPDLGIIFEPRILGPILGLCVLALLPVAVRGLRRRGAEG